MHALRYLALAAAIGFSSMAATPKAEAQINVQIGGPPVCPYGYYNFAPYNCSPYGYYGPEWFNGGVFIGAGRWFHGPNNFHGYVDNRYDPHNGYHGPYPEHSDQRFNHFHGNEWHDGRGHVGHDEHHDDHHGH